MTVSVAVLTPTALTSGDRRGKFNPQVGKAGRLNLQNADGSDALFQQQVLDFSAK